jgi:hypothetical protein
MAFSNAISKHLVKALLAAIAECDGADYIAKHFQAEVKLNLINMSDEELWELASLTAHPPVTTTESIYKNHKLKVAELSATSDEWMKDL